MLLKDLFPELTPLRDDLARDSNPVEPKKATPTLPVFSHQTPEWVTRIRSAERVPHDESDRAATTYETHPTKSTRAPDPMPTVESDDPLTITIRELAAEIAVPISDVEDAAIQQGLPQSQAQASLTLYASEVDILLDFFAERWKWRQNHPIDYRPSADGRISFETYERIPQFTRDKLTAEGFLPTRAELLKRPDQTWSQVKRHAEIRRPENKQANSFEVPIVRTNFKPFSTSTSVGSTLIPKMKAVLDPMSPTGYAKFFSLMRALLALDAKISREIGSTPGYLTTNRQHAEIIDAVCKYGFGMFAYEQAGKRLEKRAKSKPNPTREKAIESLMRLRPMYQGLLTDVAHQRFVTWRVGEVWDFVEFRFDDMFDWLAGLETGKYVPLTTHITRVSGSSQLPSRDAALIKYMIQASDNLREGNAQRTSTPGATGPGNSRKNASKSGSHEKKARTLGYRATQNWLVPICVVDGTVETSLDRDFFSGTPLSPHQVRSFYRRPRGSGVNALKTEFVNGHTRGGKSLFHSPDLLPSVTIMKK